MEYNCSARCCIWSNLIHACIQFVLKTVTKITMTVMWIVSTKFVDPCKQLNNIKNMCTYKGMHKATSTKSYVSPS